VSPFDGPPRLLQPTDHLESFDCAEPSLVDWLQRRALNSHGSGAARVYVVTREGAVVGYYALSTIAVLQSDLPGKVRRNMPDPVPGILLGRLAVETKAVGLRLGSALVRDAILRTVQVADSIGVRALFVHALHDRAAAFYAHHDFEPSPTDPHHVFLLVKDARAALGRT
jgi:predicted N-acetyltransferase YhbS